MTFTFRVNVLRNTRVYDAKHIATILIFQKEMPGPVAVPVAKETTKLLDEVHSPELAGAHVKQPRESEPATWILQLPDQKLVFFPPKLSYCRRAD